MDIDPRIFFTLLTVTMLLAIMLVSVVITYLNASKRLKRLEDNEDALYKKTIQEERDLAHRAQIDYQKTIEEAQARAKEIISQAQTINDNTKAIVSKAIQELSENEKKEVESKSRDLFTQYENEISKINSNNIQVFQNASREIQDKINAHFDELKKLMASQTVESHKAAEEKIKGEYEELEKELKKYKEEQFQKIDSNIYEILLKISKVAFGYGLNFQEHQGLIVEALERAKTEGDLTL
jgi:hypothetical protein